MQKKIMFFTPSLNVGGLERITLTYANALADRGYNVTYVICHNRGVFTSEINNNINLIDLTTNHLRNSIFRLAKEIKEIRPEYFVTTNDSTSIAVISKWLACSSVKVIAFQHSYITDNESNTFRAEFIIRFFFRFCYRIIAVSSGIRDMLIEHLKVNESKVKIILNPIDASRILELSAEEVFVPNKYIVFVGRLSPVKNLTFLLAAFKKFLGLRDDFKLVIVGDGVEKEKLLTLVNVLGIADYVVFAGEQSNPYPYIKNAKLVVLPSLSEALPTVIIESMVLGKTVVATPTKGAKEILKNGLGYIIKSFDDEKELSEMISYAIDAPIPSDILQNESAQYGLNIRVSEFEKCL